MIKPVICPPESFHRVGPINKRPAETTVQIQDSVSSYVAAVPLCRCGKDDAIATAINIPKEMVTTQETPLHAHSDITPNAKRP